ncbi:MAG TPA: RDD family protein [Dehalococcoidia bacterium]|nr:RDD family protein [Dehalococcoidia bacterium]
MTLPRTAERETNATHLRTRIGGYAVDMVIFAAITMVLTVLAGFVLLASTNWAEDDPSDAQFYLFLGIIGIGVPLVWSALNVALLVTRGQTGGQYVAGLKLVLEDGAAVRLRDAVVWWLCANPLLFNWPMTLVAGFSLLGVISLVASQLVFVLFGVIVTLCLASPVIALVSASIDRHHRALHDRVARVVAVPAE